LGNMYHNMEEVFSIFQTMDVLEQQASDFRFIFAFTKPTTATGSEKIRLVQLDGQLDSAATEGERATIHELHILPQVLELWSHLVGRPQDTRFKRLAESVSRESGLCFSQHVVLPMRACSGEILTRVWSGDKAVHQPNRVAFRYIDRIVSTFPMLQDTGAASKRVLIQRREGETECKGRCTFTDDFERLAACIKKMGASISSQDFANISYAEQLRLVRQSNVLLGVHGAGLTQAVYLPKNGGLVEIGEGWVPLQGFSVANIFMNLAEWTGHGYRHVQGHSDGDYMRFKADEACKAVSELLAGS